MFQKFKNWWEDADPIWTIKAYLSSPVITPTKTKGWVIEHDCSWSGNSEDGKWSYYWYGDFKTGYEVRVRLTPSPKGEINEH